MKRPRLRSDLAIVEQVYRGEHSYVVKDREAQKYFRFRPLEFVVMQHFDGERTPADVSAALAEQGLPFKPAAVESFVRKLGQMGLLERTVAERSVLLMERLRAERTRRVKRTHYAGSILRLRWSVGDPDALLTRWLPRLRFFFSRPFLVLSVALFLVYFVIVALRWPEFSRELSRVYTPSAYTLEWFAILWGTAVVVIIIHEFGHAFTCKYYGGEVHEMGAMLIYGQPAFYCNVNDAWTFPELKARLWVTAAGSWIQMVAAGIAALVWWAAEPETLISQVMLIASLICGVMTVLGNANPLIPLDGYYALSDYLEIPNLRQRAFGYLGWLIKRYLLRLAVPEPPVDARERRVFVAYGLLALAYSVSILTLVAGRFFGWMSALLGTVGVIAFALILWSALKRGVRSWAQVVVTAFREHRSFWRAPRLGWAGGSLAGLIALGLLVPWPIRVGGTFTASATAVLALTAPEAGMVARVYARDGTRVPPGAPILVLRNVALEREALALLRRVDSLGLRELEARSQQVTGEIRRLEAAQAEAQAALAALRGRLELLTVRAPVAAVVATPRLDEAVGRWVERGDTAVRLLGSPDSVQLRIALERAGAPLVRPGQEAALIPYSDVGAALRTPVVAVSAAARGSEGGGEVEARALVPAGRAYRPGVTGWAKITVRRASVLGALWWAVRKRVRSDFLL